MEQKFPKLRRWTALGTALIVAVGCASTTPYLEPMAVEDNLADTRGDLTQQEKDLLSRIQKDPGDFDAYYNLAVAYEQRGAVNAAENAYRKTLLLEPKHIAASVNLSGLYRARGDNGKAIVTLNDLFDTGVDDPRARTDLAILYRLDGDYERSLYESSEVLRRFGLVYGAMLNAGLVYYDQGRLEMALTLFLELSQQYPEDSPVHLSLGNTYQALGNPIAAEKEYLKAIELDPEAYEAHNNVGLLKLIKQDYASAVTAFSTAVSANVNFALGYMNLGIAYRNLSKFKESARAYRRAIEIRPRYNLAWYNLGLLYDDHWNRPDMAIDIWERYLKGFNKELDKDKREKIENRLAALRKRSEEMRAQSESESEPEPEPEPEPTAEPAAAATAPAEATAATEPGVAEQEPAPTEANEGLEAPDFVAIADQYNNARLEAGMKAIDPGVLMETLATKAAELEQAKGVPYTFIVEVTVEGKPKLVPRPLQ